METLKLKLQTELVSAMKSKDSVELLTLRSIMTALTNAEKSGKSVNEMDILKTLAKQRRQSIEAYEGASKMDLAEQEKTELLVIERFLPKAMTESEIKVIVTEMVSELDSFDQKMMGSVMGKFNKEYPGQDGKVVSQIIKSFL